MSIVDVLVVGGGPAGASTAFQLARRGAKVRIVDKATFPRGKACAECLSPQASRLLHEMGVLADLERRGAAMTGMLVRSPDGTPARGHYAAGHGYRGFRDSGLSIRRELLDVALLDAAHGAGAEVEHAKVTDVVRDENGVVRGVAVTDDRGTREIRSELVVGADGLRSVVARRLGLSRSSPWPTRVAVVAHYLGVRDVGSLVEMHAERDGFAGIADVGGGATTVAAVFPRSRAREMASRAEPFLRAWLRPKPHLAPRFANAALDGPARVTGPFASRARRAFTPGVFLVGDGGGFFDPFTGEGIYAGLRGGELVADAAMATLSAATSLAAKRAGAAYETARRNEFGGKGRVEWVIGLGVASPIIMNRAARGLAARKPLADLLAGVTGDFVPARQVLRPSYFAQLFLPAAMLSA